MLSAQSFGAAVDGTCEVGSCTPAPLPIDTSVRAESGLSFFARQDYYPSGNRVEAADVNGDGRPDLISAGIEGVTVLLGNGDGTFRMQTQIKTAMAGESSFAVGDLNGDGKPDLIFAGGLTGVTSPQGVGVMLGNGDGTFAPLTFYAAGSDNYVNSVVVGDFNGDGIPDAVVAGEQGVWVFPGVGDGTLNLAELEVALPSEYAALASADLNGDHRLDLVVCLPNGESGFGAGFAVLFGNGNGTFQAPQFFSEPAQPTTVTIGDANGDGYPDIALSSPNYGPPGPTYLYIGNGRGGFSTPEQVALPHNADVAIGDVNGDGIPDLVTPGVDIAFGAGNGTFSTPVSYAVANDPPFNVVLASLRGNGRTDIVSEGYGLSILLSEGKGKFEDGEWTALPAAAGCGVAADFNGDGKPDLAVNTSAGISILLGTGKATAPYSLGTSIALANAGCLTASGDVNGDGIPDLVISSAAAILTYLGNGDGTFNLKSTTPTSKSSDGLVLGDFNHDGKVDFATAGNLMALGNGDGTFQTPTPLIENAPNFGFIAAGDLDNDGWTDLVLTAAENNFVYVLVNNHHGGFQESVTRAKEPTQIGPIALGDLNMDGNLDAAISQSGGGALIFTGDGKGNLAFQELLANSVGSAGALAIADVNGDGIPDLLEVLWSSVAIYPGIGHASFQTPFYLGGGPSPAYVLVENLHGQTAAGQPDIVLPDATGGVTTLLNLGRQD